MNDALILTVDAVDRAISPAYAKRKSFLSDLNLIQVIVGRPPSAKVDHQTLTVVITPTWASPARLSMACILKALFRRGRPPWPEK